MPLLNKPYIQTSNPYESVERKTPSMKSIFYGEVISIDDETDGGRIKVNIIALDGVNAAKEDLPDCYPLLPKFFHIYPQVGEIVRIFIQDMKYPKKGRFWLGSIISQPQKIGLDSIYTALSTTNVGVSKPEKAPSTYPDAIGVYPTKEEVAVVGRVNTDIILRDSQLEFRAGKHEFDNTLKLNVKNPASITLSFEGKPENEKEYYSSTVTLSDKIGLFSHDGNPKFKAARIDSEDRVKMFEEGHPLGRGDLIVEIFEIFRRAMIAHIHPYAGLPVDKNSIIKDLEKLDFEAILQKNIVIN